MRTLQQWLDTLHPYDELLGESLSNMGRCYAAGQNSAQSRITELEQENASLRDEVEKLREDAQKWRALIACERMRVHGGAGIGKDSLVDPSTNYAHVSIDLFTKYGDCEIDDSSSREYFEGFIEVAVRALEGRES